MLSLGHVIRAERLFDFSPVLQAKWAEEETSRDYERHVSASRRPSETAGMTRTQCDDAANDYRPSPLAGIS
jgi:hypothetical protein